jgi:hypothetical protein
MDRRVFSKLLYDNPCPTALRHKRYDWAGDPRKPMQEKAFSAFSGVNPSDREVARGVVKRIRGAVGGVAIGRTTDSIELQKEQSRHSCRTID